jgi:hypothetical protein
MAAAWADSDSRQIQSESELDAALRPVSELATALYKMLDLIRDLSRAEYSIERSIPLQLIDLLQRWPVVSMGVLQWIGTLLTDKAQVCKASFGLLVPILLQLIVTASDAHPAQRHECFDLLRQAASLEESYTAREIDFQRAISIRKDCLECMVYLLGLGYVSESLLFFARFVRITKDTAMVRHLLLLVVNSLSPPYSPYFLYMLSVFLLALGGSKDARTALQHERFGSDARSRLAVLVSAVLDGVERSCLGDTAVAQLREFLSELKK